MSATVGYATLQVIPSTRGFAGALSGQVNGPLAAAGKSSGKRAGLGFVGGFGKALPLLGGAMAAVGAVSFLSDSIAEAEEFQKQAKITDQVLRTMGKGAGVTGDQVRSLNEALEAKTAVDAAVIAKGSNILLTFSNIRNEVGKGNDVFTRANSLAVDLSTVFGGDVSGSAKLLGKALNNPIKGLTALSRVGVSFTDGEKAKITALVKSGKALDAQKIILAAIEKQVGGTAAASVTSSDRIRQGWANVKEGVGKALLPALAGVTDFVAGQLFPALERGAKALGPIFRTIGGVVKQVFGVLGSGDFTSGPLSEDSPFVNGLFAVREVIESLAPVFSNLVGSFRSASGPASTVGRIFATIRDVVGTLVSGIATQLLPIVASVVRSLITNLQPTITAIGTVIRDTVAPAVLSLVEKLRGFLPVALTVGKVIGTVVGFVLKLAFAILGKVLPVVVRLAGFLIGTLFRSFGVTISIIGTVIRWVGMLGSKFVGAIRKVGEFVSGAREKFGSFLEYVRGIPGRILKGLGNLGETLKGAGGDLIRGLWEGIQSLGDWLKDKIVGFVADKIPGPVKKALGIQSPSRVFAALGRDTVRGFALGVDRNASLAERSVTRAITAPDAPAVASSSASGSSTGAGARGAGSVTVPVYLDGRLIAKTVFDIGGRDLVNGRAVLA